MILGGGSIAAGATAEDETGVSAVLEASPVSDSFAGVTAQEQAVEANVVTVAGTDSDVSVVLPVSAAAEVTERDGVLSYADDDSYSIVPAMLEDGSVAIHSVLNDATSPTEFTYELNLSADAVLTVDESSGGVIGVNADGSVAVMVAAPWAKDANGKNVPTAYTVEGHTLTQHVEVPAGTAYPIVADPWMGINLVDSFNFNYVNGYGWRLNVNPTVWARGLTGNALWASAGAAGWDELRNKMSVQNKARLNNSGRDQYICHMGFAGFDAQWNMELWKKPKPLAVLVSSGCN
jgi:hypothetical protein